VDVLPVHRERLVRRAEGLDSVLRVPADHLLDYAVRAPLSVLVPVAVGTKRTAERAAAAAADDVEALHGTVEYAEFVEIQGTEIHFAEVVEGLNPGGLRIVIHPPVLVDVTRSAKLAPLLRNPSCRVP
jgi:hypothetical protein